MIAAPCPWLPESGFAGPPAVEPLARALDAWSAEWLTGSRLAAPFAWERADQRGLRSHDRNGTVGIHLAPAAGGRTALAAALFGVPIDERARRTVADDMLIADIIDAASADLRRRIEACFPAAREADAPPSVAPEYALPITLSDGEVVFTIHAAQPLLIVAARLRAGPSRKPGGLALRSEALVDHTVTLNAVIGRNRVALPDLEKLGIGDVIALDTATTAPLELCVGPSWRARDAATITLADAHFAIRIERPVQEW